MVSFTTLDRLVALEQEMAAAGRTAEQRALHEARLALVRDEDAWMTTGEAAEQLAVSIPTVKRWVARGTLSGQVVGVRWLVSRPSVEQVLVLRQALGALDQEGNPTEEEIAEIADLTRHAATDEHPLA